jgi:hypothetical protein
MHYTSKDLTSQSGIKANLEMAFQSQKGVLLKTPLTSLSA